MKQAAETLKNAVFSVKTGLTVFAAWSAQASGRAPVNPPDSGGFCDQRRSDLMVKQRISPMDAKNPGLPRGVIGNTRVFGTRIPGSSPGRVVFLN